MNFDLQLVLGFFLLAIPAYFTPGPNNLMLLGSVMKFGWRRTLPHAAGIMIGFPFMVFALALGLGEVFTLFPILKTILKYAAAAYFLWMAWRLLGFKVSKVSGEAKPLNPLQAVMFQWVNPKAWAMGTGLASAFVVPGDYRFASIIWLTLGCVLISPMSSAAWMFFGQQLQVYLTNSGAERLIGPLLAGLMVVAVVLFLV